MSLQIELIEKKVRILVDGNALRPHFFRPGGAEIKKPGTKDETMIQEDRWIDSGCYYTDFAKCAFYCARRVVEEDHQDHVLSLADYVEELKATLDTIVKAMNQDVPGWNELVARGPVKRAAAQGGDSASETADLKEPEAVAG